MTTLPLPLPVPDDDYDRAAFDNLLHQLAEVICVPYQCQPSRQLIHHNSAN